MSHPPICALLDDYQNAALSCADWTALDGKIDLRRFDHHLGSMDEIAAALAPCSIVVAMRERTAFPAELLARLPNLKLLITTGQRNRSIDVAAAHDLGITVCGTRSGTGPAAELAWGGLLALMRRIPQEMRNLQQSGPWQTSLGRSLEGRKLGVVGLGKQGARMVRYGQAFGMEVCGWTRTDLTNRSAELGVTPLPIETLFSTCDVVAMQLALTDQTRGIVGRNLLRSMRADAVLVNAARGGLIDETALIEALQQGRISGAVLDVFDQEPLPADHPFRSLSNVIATPHIGYATQENYRVFYGDVVETIEHWLRGTVLRPLTPAS